MTSSFRNRVRVALVREVDGSTLGIFRILWGLLMCVEANWLHNQLRDLHNPEFVHFYFQGFSWIRHLPSPWMMELEMIVMLISAVLMVFGLQFRPAAAVFCLTFAHFFFSEAIAYNNHFYLIILVNFLLVFTRADAKHSLRQWFRGREGFMPEPVPAWNYWILRFQVIIVYFYGAVAKLSRDWLVEMEPVRFWLQNSQRPPDWLSRIVRQEWFTPFTVWGGLLIDLICPFMLLFARTRLFAIVVLVLFHAINSQIFNIGYFPIMGILLILPFLPASLRRRSGQTPEAKSETAENSVGGAQFQGKRGAVFCVLAIYFVFQLLFPLRWHLWRPANPLWTDKGQPFSWQMMLREQIADVQIRFADPVVKAWVEQRPGLLPEIAPSARISIGQNPYLIWQYAQAVKATLAEYGKGDAAIHAFATCSLNGRPYYPIIDPNVDLGKAECPFFGIPEWIPPLPDLKVDYAQISPLKDKLRFSDEAIEQWLAKNPGPAVGILKMYSENEPVR